MATIRPRLLIVDDDIEAAPLLRQILSDIGETFCSTSGPDALVFIAKNQPDLVLIDARMPGMDGFEICSTIRKETSCRNLPVILITAVNDPDSETLGLACGAADCISRPLNATLVKERIRTHLALRLKGSEQLSGRAVFRQAEAELQPSQHMLKNLTANLPGMLYQYRLYPDGRSSCPFISASVREICGLSPEELQKDATPWINLTHPDDREELVQTGMESARTLQPWRLEYRALLPGKGVRWLSGEASPQKLEDGSFLWHGYIRDITESKNAKERERRLMNMYRALSETSEAILHLKDESALFPLVCRIAVEYGAMLLAWVGIPDADNRFAAVASHGKIDQAYTGHITVRSDKSTPEGRGPAGTAYRDRRPVVVNDFATDETMAPWRERAIKEGLNSMAAVPILKAGNPYAVLIVYSDHVGAFDDEIMRLLEEMTANISFALDNFDREALRHQAESALRQSEARLKGFYNAGLIGVIYWKTSGEIVEANDKFLEMTGYGREDIQAGRIDWIKMTPTLYLERDRQAVSELMEAGIHQVVEKEYIRKDDTCIPVIVARARLDESKSDGVAFVMDITERKKAQAALQLTQIAVDRAINPVCLVAPDGRIHFVNEAACRHLGYSSEEFRGLTIPDINPIKPIDEWKTYWEMLKEKKFCKFESVHRKKDGHLFPVEIISNYINHEGQEYSFAFWRDITEDKKSEELIWKQANFDALTGLPNRRMFLERLEQDILKAQRTQTPLTVMYLDLDYFKDVNDTLGHDKGDLLLKEAARRISNCIRKTDTVARLGGDEFTIVLAEMSDLDGAERIARNILEKLAEPYFLEDEVAYVSASVGIALYPGDASGSESLLKYADQAMYASKERGKNRYSYYDATMQEAAVFRHQIVKHMHSALENRQFHLVYQPIVELATNAVYKAEALLRWHHPERGLIGPAEFIPFAEQTGLIVEIGNWVFREAARTVKHLRETFHPGFQISVNKSPVQFRKHGSLYKTWFNYMHELGLAGCSVAIEITESLLMDSTGLVTKKLNAFRRQGMQISLDDFGTGYSSLSYLKKFNIDYLKIDRAFVSHLTDGSDDMALCEAIIVMAHKLGIKVIAEGIETEEQRRLLVSAGCDFGQGYLFSRPISAEKLDEFLSADARSTAP